MTKLHWAVFCALADPSRNSPVLVPCLVLLFETFQVQYGSTVVIAEAYVRRWLCRGFLR